jgi:hypothetical protein
MAEKVKMFEEKRKKNNHGFHMFSKILDLFLKKILLQFSSNEFKIDLISS